MARVFQRPDRAGWWVEYRDAEGRKRREKCRSKDTAQKLLARRLDEVDKRRKLGTPETRNVTFDDFAEIYLSRYAAQKSAYQRDELVLEVHLIPTFAGKLLSQITRADIDAYTARRAALVKPATVNRELGVLSRMLSLAVEWDYLETAPRLRRLRVHATKLVFLEPDEIRRLLAVCLPRYRTLFAFLILTGLRREEALSLRWPDVDLERGLVTLARTKNWKGRVVPMPDNITAMLAALERNGEYVFQWRGKRLQQNRIQRPLKSAVLRAGIDKPVSPHTFRHTYASLLVMAGVDLVTVAELLGHSSLEMVRRYAHLSESHRIQAAKRLGSVLDTVTDTEKVSDS